MDMPLNQNKCLFKYYLETHNAFGLGYLMSPYQGLLTRSISLA